MSGETIQLEMPDGVADAYLARPDGGTAPDAIERPPAVLLICDAYGLRPQIEAMADRIAAAGYLVLAPNVFYRAGRPPVVSLEGLDDPDRRGEVFGRVWPLIQGLTSELIARDGAAYLDELARRGRGGPVAIVGYCMGGRLGWRIATAYPDRVALLAGFHVGSLVTDDPGSPHHSAAALDSELYLGFADEDPSMTAEQIAALERALDEAGRSYRAEVYPGAAHGYTMADTPAYDEAAAERHYETLLALLDRTIGSRRDVTDRDD